MDQRKTGIFIAKCRKEKGLTQSNMAERLGITDRAISKWERGKSFPDPSIMVELCKVLDISANELLSGEKLTGDKYIVKAEENLTMLKKIERDSNRKLLVMENVIGILGITSFLTMIFTSGFWVNDIFGKIFLMAIGILIF